MFRKSGRYQRASANILCHSGSIRFRPEVEQISAVTDLVPEQWRPDRTVTKKSAEKMSQERRPQHKQLTTYSSCAHTFRARAFVWLHHKTITTIWCNWPVIKPIYNRSSSDANEKQMSTQSIRHHIYCCGSYFSHVKCNNLTSKSAHTFTVIPTVPEKNYRTGARFSKKS